MTANTLLVTIAILLALGFWLMDELRFLIPYKPVLIHLYGRVILFSIAVLFLNLFAGIYFLQRKFFLKDTGRKLIHFDRQIASGQSSLPVPDSEGDASKHVS